MNCPTCTAKMRTLGTAANNRPINYCDRCGTIRIGVQHSALFTPTLVDRAREFISVIENNPLAYPPGLTTCGMFRGFREAATGRADK